jgi:hypothetical protein
MVVATLYVKDTIVVSTPMGVGLLVGFIALYSACSCGPVRAR